ncbi:fructosamine kinase family protein [Aestuariibaculum sp. M13]|uniref:fructosamine kinase family protein n=1 Tax=Aestuariibaculum sp. M13 TaxID=2967132 RepID=UPI002159C8C0|nr:fructosamine kinase family protein [Aestuariibaculum sp. M13]MCR8668559.1 fructosamine kinase family protein [Aestuariibaculum sp. M13]
MMVFYFYDMTEDFIAHISKQIKAPIESIHSVSGGDISSAYKIITSGQSYFLKTNTISNALQMFQTEAEALKTIANTNTISTPKVLDYSQFKNTSFLLLEFIDSKSPDSEDFKTLGRQLAELHKNTNAYFGLQQDDFIGSLIQYNKPTDSWNSFYVNERLYPQLQLAIQRQLLLESECPSKGQMLNKLNPLFQNIKPSLLHGDLWSGNYLIATNGKPYLIDPAMYFGDSEVDIAMTKLFGGFSEDFYKAYHNMIPEDEFTSNRIEVYQLYYLLIHLNLFGKSYYSSVINLLKKYF